jgi:hypothetical protein
MSVLSQAPSTQSISLPSSHPPSRQSSVSLTYSLQSGVSQGPSSQSTSTSTHLGDCVADFDLSTCLKGIPTQLAPPISLPDPILIDARTPRRVVSNPSQDPNARKSVKLAIKGVAEGDRKIISAALNRLEALIMTHDPFPSEKNFRALATQANVWACKKFNKGNLKLTPDSDYETLVSPINFFLTNCSYDVELCSCTLICLPCEAQSSNTRPWKFRWQIH